MVKKKMMRILSIVGILCFWQILSETNVQLHQDEQASLLSGEEKVMDLNEYAIIGAGAASCGNNAVTGKACLVLKSKQLDKIRKGDIVIAPAIHSTWYPQLSTAAGIITEKGDESSNAIAFGKKLGIPVIVGVSDATRLIVDGQTIICDPITRNIYHVGYSHSPEVRFDKLHIPQKDEQQTPSVHDKLGKPGKVRPAHAWSVPTSDITANYCIPQQHENKQDPAITIHKENKNASRVKTIFSSHFNSFKDYVFGMRLELKAGRHMPRWMLKSVGGCDDFAIDCIPLSFSFFDSDKDDMMRILNSLGSDDYAEYIGDLLVKCSKKPHNMSELNWVSRVSHEEQVKAMPLPSEIKKEELIKDPKKCKELEAKIKEEDKREFIEKQKTLTALGVFLRFCAEKKIQL